MAAARPHPPEHRSTGRPNPGALAGQGPHPDRPPESPRAATAKPEAPTGATPWPGPIGSAGLALGLAGLTLLSWAPQAPALPAASPAKAPDQPASNRGASDRDGGYGFWQIGTSSCSRNLAGSPPSSCQQVQLDQQTEGLLTVRFIAPGAERDSLNQLIVVGLLEPNSQPLACQQGRCQPAGPLSTVVSTVSERSFNGRGLAQGLPKAWLATGSCRFEGRSLRCEATAPGGERWQGNARF